MNSLIKKLSSCVLPRDQLLPLLDTQLCKKSKKCDLPWVEVVKRLLSKSADEDCKALFENASTIIRIHLDETVKNGLKNPNQLSQKYSNILNSLLTHLHFTMEDTNLQEVEMSSLSPLILGAVIDMIVAAHKKGQEASTVAKIFMKLTMVLGHSPEQLLDALLTSRSLVHPSSRQPAIQVPLIKRLFSSIRGGQAMAPVLYLKYLLLGKLWLFMVDKNELGQTRTYIAKMLKLPDGLADWAKRERVPWLTLSQWSTRLILKKMTLLGALETFYGKGYEVIVIATARDRQAKRAKSSASQETKPGASKSFTNKGVVTKVKADNSKDRAQAAEIDSDEDVEQEREIVDVEYQAANDAAPPGSSRTEESVKKQKNKRKSVKRLAQTRKKRKIQNDMEEEEIQPSVTSKSTLSQKTKAGPSTCSVIKNFGGKRKTKDSSLKIAEESPKAQISEADSDGSMKENLHIVGVNDYTAEEGTPPCNKSTVEKAGKKDVKRKSEEALVQKVKKKRKAQSQRVEESTAALNSEMEKTLHKKKPKTLVKECKKVRNIKTGNSINSNLSCSSEEAESITGSFCTSGFMPEIVNSCDVEEQSVARKLCKKSRKRPLMDREDLGEEIQGRSCLFEEVLEHPAAAFSVGLSDQKARRRNSGKQKLSKKQQRRQRKCMTFAVTDLEGKTDNGSIDSKDNEFNVSEVNNRKVVNIIPTKHQNTRNLLMSTDRCNTSSEDSRDNTRSGGDEAMGQESCKATSVIENLTSIRKEEVVVIIDSDRDAGLPKHDNEQKDADRYIYIGSIGTSENSDEPDQETVHAEHNTSHASENISSMYHKEHQLVKVSNAEDSNEELEVEWISTGSNLVNGVDSNEKSNSVIIESGSDEVNGDCDTMHSTNNLSSTFKNFNVNLSEASETASKSWDTSTDYENGEESDIAITECTIAESVIQDIKINNSSDDTVDLIDSVEPNDDTVDLIDSFEPNDDTVDLIDSFEPSDVGGDDDKGNIVTVDEVEVIGYMNLNVDRVQDSKTLNNSPAITVPGSGYAIKAIKGEVITSKTNEAPQHSGDDCEILEAPRPDKLCTDGATETFTDSKEAPVMGDMRDLLKDEMKQEREIKQSTPIDDRNTKMTSSVPHPKCSIRKNDVSQDPVSKMMNKFYKSKSNIVKIEEEEKERNTQSKDSEILNNHHSSEAPATGCLEDGEKISLSRQNSGLEASVSGRCKQWSASTSDGEDDKSVVIVEDTEEIETMLQSIVKDTGRLTSIDGLRERLFDHTAVKEELKESSDHSVEEDNKEHVKNSEVSSLCVSQVKTLDTVDHQSPESHGSTGDINDKSVQHLKDNEDTESLLQSIVQDPGQLAGIRGLRERLIGKAALKEETVVELELENDKDSKEAADNSDTFSCDTQCRRAEESSKNLQCKEVNETLLSSDKLSPNSSAPDPPDARDTFKAEPGITVVGGGDQGLSNGNTQNNSNILDIEVENVNIKQKQEEELENSDTKSQDIDVVTENQDSSNSKCYQDRERTENEDEESVCIPSDSRIKENNLVSAMGVEATEKMSPKALDNESLKIDQTVGLSEANISSDSFSLVLDSSTTEIESVIEESIDKSTEGADEAYEASSDASEDPAPRIRRRTRSLRKSCIHPELRQASDSDSSPARAACWRASAVDGANPPRPRRRRSQSCSLETMAPGSEAANTTTQTLESSVNGTFTPAKDCSFDKTFTPAKDCSFDKTFTPAKDCSFDKTLTPAKDCSFDKTFTSAKDCSFDKTFTSAKDCSFDKTFTPAKDRSFDKTFTSAKDCSFDKTFTPAKDRSFNKTFTLGAKNLILKASFTDGSPSTESTECYSNEENLLLALNETIQDVFLEDSEETTCVEDKKVVPRPSVPEPQRSGAALPRVHPRTEAEEEAHHPPVKAVLDETVKINAAEFPSHASSQSSWNEEGDTLLSTNNLSSSTLTNFNVKVPSEASEKVMKSHDTSKDYENGEESHSGLELVPGHSSELVLGKENISPSSDTTLTEPFIKPASPGRTGPSDAARAESPGLGRDEGTHLVVVKTDQKSCASHNEVDATSNKSAILSDDNSDKSQECEMLENSDKFQECEILINRQNPSPEKWHEKSTSNMKEIENRETDPKVLTMEARDTGDAAAPAQALENRETDPKVLTMEARDAGDDAAPAQALENRETDPKVLTMEARDAGDDAAPAQALENRETDPKVLTMEARDAGDDAAPAQALENRETDPKVLTMEARDAGDDAAPAQALENRETDPKVLTMKARDAGDDAAPAQALENRETDPKVLTMEARDAGDDAAPAQALENRETDHKVLTMEARDTGDKAAPAQALENRETDHKVLTMEERDTGDKAAPAQALENRNENEETRTETRQSEKTIVDDSNQEMTQGYYEGEEVEVATSGIEEEDEGETAGVTPVTYDENEVGAKNVDLTISKKSLRSHVRHLYSAKDSKEGNLDSPSMDGKLTPIPAVKVHCLSEVALTKEVLISPDVSDEECELVSPGIHLNDVKFPVETDTREDSAPQKNDSVCLSNLSSPKSSGGINSPHKLIPEEQDESTVPKPASESTPKTLKRSKTLTHPPSLCTPPSSEKLEDRNTHPRRSSRGARGESPLVSPLKLDTPKSSKSLTKSGKAMSSIPELIPESMQDTPHKSTVEIKGQERSETTSDVPTDLGSLAGSHDLHSIASLCTDKDSTSKKMQISMPSVEYVCAGSSGTELNGSFSASCEKLLPSQNEASEHLCEDLDETHDAERCDAIKSPPAKNSAPDAPGEDSVLRQDNGTEKTDLASHTEEESCGDVPRVAVGRPRKRLSSTSSSSSQSLLPVRRSSRLRKQPNGLSD